MIIVFAGRRPSPDDFPEGLQSEVGARIARVLRGLQPRLIVGSAAAGADLLTLEAGLTAGAKARVILAGDVNSFRESSVADVGGDWLQRYDQVLDHGDVTVENIERVEDDDEATYRAATERIWEIAQAERVDGEEVIALVISRPRENGGFDHSEAIAGKQMLENGVVLRVNPLQADVDLPRAFVAMPFGRRSWHELKIKRYEADLTYKRLLLPALIDAGYDPMRADTQALMEVIDTKMLLAIGRSRLVVADLATTNPNVMWELGVRHAWHPSGTVLVAPEGAKPPFDVARVTVHHYKRGATAINDHDCVNGIRMLQEVLADVDREDVDSPVFSSVPGLEPVRLPEEPADVEEDVAAQYLEAISFAADLGDAERLLALTVEITDTAELRDSSRPPLLGQVGLALIDLGRHGEAAEILRPLAEDDVHYKRTALQTQFAHALIRDPADASRDERLAEAERRLQRLLEARPDDPEAHGLLGSAAKARIELAVASGGNPLPHLELALKAYEDGLRSDPGDFYPGINTVALRRLRGQHLRPSEDDLTRARELLPVVRFAVLRRGEEVVEDDLWAMLTVGECALHQCLLDGDERARTEMEEFYERAAGRAKPNQRHSARRQLELFLAAGDPPEVIEPLLGLFPSDGGRD